jgi:ADP-ribose pyrophosphatase YjhB (NUDIX family)
VARDPDGRVLLVRGSKQDTDPGVWSLPGGGVEHGESPHAGVIREYAEETGLAIVVSGLRDVFSDVQPHYRGHFVHTDRVIYDVRVSGGTLRNERDGTSDLAEWVEPDQLAGLSMHPFTARVLGLPADDDPTPEVVQDSRDGVTKVQRFGAYGVITGPDGRLLLSRIAPGYPGADTWHLPGGGTDFGEQPQAGVLREIVEETDQTGRIVGLLAVSSLHRPVAYGPEGVAMDWHTVRVVYRVAVDEPTVPKVTEAAGGSTAEAAWISRDELDSVRLNEFARTSIARTLG